MRPLTIKEQTILKVVKSSPHGASPTTIGMSCGQPYHKASSWASSALRVLVERGLIERIQPEPSVVLYKEVSQ